MLRDHVSRQIRCSLIFLLHENVDLLDWAVSLVSDISLACVRADAISDEPCSCPSSTFPSDIFTEAPLPMSSLTWEVAIWEARLGICRGPEALTSAWPPKNLLRSHSKVSNGHQRA